MVNQLRLALTLVTSHCDLRGRCLIGSAFDYGCEVCGHQFRAEEDFSFGMSGKVSTPVVCPKHGLKSADTGVNMMGGELTPEISEQRQFPCPKCGKEVPRWDRKSCPKCGSERLEHGDEILFD